MAPETAFHWLISKPKGRMAPETAFPLPSNSKPSRMALKLHSTLKFPKPHSRMAPKSLHSTHPSFWAIVGWHLETEPHSSNFQAS
ncbi:hypothetical protein AVEN_67185-1 [Araneus ventricosus]|uniref:Uncharacterized protein n=1 Tax=Araneus ventricosus TaxID=182803 RepID=A0A4Y2HDE0_ARAVE|nr:hypothetical protein AVEN_67185-1 [Araneus ventricosus]